MFASTPPANGAPSSNQRQPRTLILCFDGTANQYDGQNTNVVRLYALFKKDDNSDQQLCYYQPGIGTYLNPGMVSPIFQWCAKILDEAFAWYLDEHVRQGYTFLMQNYTPGDKIYMFGFSRGAYTARALAGMLHKIGLLPKDNPEQLPFAYKLYKSTDAENVSLAAGFKQTFCRDVQIEFVGVWETVTSVGVIMSRTLPFIAANTTIKIFRQALSLDEHRVKFQPNLYTLGAPSDTTGTSPIPLATSDAPRPMIAKESSTKHNILQKKLSLSSFLQRWPFKQHKTVTQSSPPQIRQTGDIEAAVGTTDTSSSPILGTPPGASDGVDGTDVLEVWFAGCHSDVGGGSVINSTQFSLSDVTLLWMVREIVLARCGVEFDQAAVKRANIPLSIFQTADTITNATTSNGGDAALPRPGTHFAAGTEVQPLDINIDALQPIHDQLSSNPAWWLLEIIPLPYTITNAQGQILTKWWIHLGRGRALPDSPKFHITVKERMEDADLKYKPRAIWTAGTETYVQ